VSSNATDPTKAKYKAVCITQTKWHFRVGLYD